ncbi:hypothetical protein FF2_007268 [Malus domestica]
MASVSASNVVALKSAVKFGATTDGRACQFKQWAPIGPTSLNSGVFRSSKDEVFNKKKGEFAEEKNWVRQVFS